MFALVNLARRLEVDPDAALRRTNAKFERRFQAIERHFAAQARDLDEVALDEMEAVWRGAKAAEG